MPEMRSTANRIIGVSFSYNARGTGCQQYDTGNTKSIHLDIGSHPTQTETEAAIKPPRKPSAHQAGAKVGTGCPSSADVHFSFTACPILSLSGSALTMFVNIVGPSFKVT